MQWDYIIVGAGSAGCALAYELCRSGNLKVLVLEAGPSDRSPFITVPAGQLHAIRRYDWGYVSQPDPSRNGKTERWERGKVLGGSSSVNGMVYVRGAASDFDRWAALGNEGWGYADVLPVFRDMECSDRVSALRGRTGRLSVETVKDPHPLTDAFLQSAVACGWPFNSDYNAADQLGVSYAQLTQRHGTRCSSARAFLKPLLRRRSLTLSLNSLVQRVNLEGGLATGVSYVSGGKPKVAEGRNIVLCSGAINSPKLLMLSGIGDRLELRRHGIRPHLSLPGVGLNLREHPFIKLTYATKVPSDNLTEGIGQKLRIAFQYVTRRTGPLAHLFEATALLKSSHEVAEADIQLHFMSMGFTKAAGGMLLPLDYPAVTIMLNKSRPRSSGRIRLASEDPGSAPLIECSLLERDEDVQTLVQGVAVVRRIMDCKPVADLIEKEVTPGPVWSDEESLKAYVRDNLEIGYHPVGTCRMGLDAAAVVTPELRVRGLDNLWVADASIMPDLISGNTNAACMMIGMKLGRQLNRVFSAGIKP